MSEICIKGRDLAHSESLLQQMAQEVHNAKFTMIGPRPDLAMTLALLAAAAAYLSQLVTGDVEQGEQLVLTMLLLPGVIASAVLLLSRAPMGRWARLAVLMESYEPLSHAASNVLFESFAQKQRLDAQDVEQWITAEYAALCSQRAQRAG